jgi:hypothetical protein
LNGTYFWANNRRQCYHKCRANRASIPPNAILDSSCCVLAFFDSMYFSPVTQTFACPKHQRLVPFAEMDQHLLQKHKTAVRRTKFKLVSLLSHLS